MKPGRTMEAKQAAIRKHLGQMTLEEKIKLPLRLYYRNLALTEALKKSHERQSSRSNV